MALGAAGKHVFRGHTTQDSPNCTQHLDVFARIITPFPKKTVQ